jgi:ribosome-binding protein aMBF1 (putative translation factor)
MPDFINQCFVCGKETDPVSAKKNMQFNLPVCDDCQGTDQEKAAITELLEGMADGFVCGCI